MAGSATGVSPVKATDASVAGYSRLSRGSGGDRFKVLTTKLHPGNAYTVWCVVSTILCTAPAAPALARRGATRATSAIRP